MFNAASWAAVIIYLLYSRLDLKLLFDYSENIRILTELYFIYRRISLLKIESLKSI